MNQTHNLEAKTLSEMDFPEGNPPHRQACSETFQRLHSPGNWAMFPEITTFSFKYVSFLAFSLAFGLKSATNYKSNIAELPANKNQNFSN